MLRVGSGDEGGGNSGIVWVGLSGGYGVRAARFGVFSLGYGARTEGWGLEVALMRRIYRVLVHCLNF